MVDQDGEMLGEMSLREALSRAQDEGLDLVEMSPNVAVPVCKLLDYSRLKYEAKKKKQEAKKKQKKHSLKEIKFRVNIGENDFNVKFRKIKSFLEDGDKVKVSLMFRGREMEHQEKGKELFEKILENLGELAKTDLEPKTEGRQIIMVLSQGKFEQIKED